MAESDRRVFWTVAAVATVGVAVLLLWSRVEEELGPEPVRAWVALQAEGEGVAEIGTLELPAGTPFRLHAVLEARRRNGEAIYYTEAPALRFGSAAADPAAAGAEVPAGSLRRWDRPSTVRVRWFTVEGKVPFIALQPGQTLERFGFEEFFRPEWGDAWSVSGTLEPANDARLVREDRQGRLPFGTQRFQARIELYTDDGDEIPRERFISPGTDGLLEHPDALPAAVLTLDGAAAPASAVFGLTQIEPPSAAVPESPADVPEDSAAATAPEAAAEMTAELVRLTRERLAFSRLALLRRVLAAGGVEAPGDLDWRRLDLEAGVSWGGSGAGAAAGEGAEASAPAVAQGDLLRVGERWVMLYRDGGDANAGDGSTTGDGRLDRDDLCFDYARGSVVRRLGDVFAGGGEVEWARLRPRGDDG